MQRCLVLLDIVDMAVLYARHPRPDRRSRDGLAECLARKVARSNSHVRILFLTQVLPYPLDAGPKIRAYYTLRYLAQRHDITLLSFVRPADRPELDVPPAQLEA